MIRHTHYSVIVLAAVCLVSCQRPAAKSSQPREEPAPVRVRKPVRIQRPAFVGASGSVEPQETADIGFQVAGRVVRVLVEEGQAVRKGQLLAELDASDYNYALRAAEAQAGMAEAGVQKAQNGVRAEELEQARAAYERAQDEYNRYRQLYERKSLAPADFRKIEAAYRVARAQFEMAQNGARSEDRSAARSALEQAQAQVAANRKRVADARLVSPIGGRVARRGIDPGEMAGAGLPVFSIVNLNPTRVRAGIPETDIGRVRPGQQAAVVIPALDDREFAGKVELVGVAADPNSRTFTVKILVPNPNELLRAGMIAEARIQGSGTIEALTLPGEAIVRDPQGATLVYVYFPDRRRVHARRVETGTVRGQDIEIRSGLTGDELVVVAGQQKLREGAVVELVNGGAR